MADEYCPFCEVLVRPNGVGDPPKTCWSCKHELNPEGMITSEKTNDTPSTNVNSYADPLVVTLLTFISGATLLIGIIVFFVIVTKDSYKDPNYALGIGVLVTSIISATFQYGFAKVISLLSEINQKLK